MPDILDKAQNLSVASSLHKILYPYGTGREEYQIDRHTLFLHIIEIMISRTFQDKMTRNQVTREVVKLLEEQYNALSVDVSQDDLSREAEKMIDFMLDRSIKYRFFDRQNQTFKSSKPFSYLTEEEDFDERLYVHPTNQSINLFLNALETSIEEKQVAYQAILHYQISQGRLADAESSLSNHINASNAHYNEIVNLRRKLRHDAGSIDFNFIKDTLNKALHDTTSFIETDREIQDLLHNMLDSDPDEDTHANIHRLNEGIMRCITIYSQLDNETREVLEEFTKQKSRLFNTNDRALTYDIAENIEAPLLELEVGEGLHIGNALFNSMLPASPKKVLDPMTYMSLLMKNARSILEPVGFEERYDENRKIVQEAEEESEKKQALDQARQVIGDSSETTLSGVVCQALRHHPVEVVRCIPYIIHTEWGLDINEARPLGRTSQISGILAFTDMDMEQERASRCDNTMGDEDWQDNATIKEQD